MTQVSPRTNYRPWQIKIFSATWLAYVGYYFCRKPFFIVKSTLADELGFNSIDLANLGTVYLACYMIGQFSSAYVGRKLGPKMLLLVGMGLSIICNSAFGISNSFWTIFLFLAINGLAQGSGWPGCIGSLAFWFKRDTRGSILGIWSTCYQLGSVVSGGFAAYLLGNYGWQWSFFGASLVLLAIWTYNLLLHPNRPEDVGLEPIEVDEETSNKPASNDTGLGWTRDVIFAIFTMGMIYFCIKFLRYALWSWVPLIINKNFAQAADTSGYISTVFDMTGFAGVLFAGFVSDKIFKGKRAFLATAMLVGMLGGYILLYLYGVTNLTIFVISMGIIGFMLYGPDSLISGVGAIDIGNKKGALAAAGIINGMGSIGPIFQEQIIGRMYAYYNQDLLPIFLMFLVVAAIGTGATAFLWYQSQKGRANL